MCAGELFTKVDGVDAKAGGDAALLAAASVAPLVTAKHLLGDFAAGGLKAGDALVQSGADGLVGQAVVQLAAAKGVKTVNIARGSPAGGWAKLSEHLQGLGATAVVSEEAADKHAFRRLLADLAPAKLGLNGTGGAAAGAVARALGEGATLVSYGGSAASGGRASALQLPLSLFAQKDLTAKGFSLDRALSQQPKAARDAAAREAVAAAASGKVRLLVAREPFKDFAAVLPRALAAVSVHKGGVAERQVVLTF
jgi:trans-2-enoyl-CoA reductase